MKSSPPMKSQSKHPTKTSHEPLEAYKKKRDFAKTTEPVGEAIASKNRLRFVVQRHAARRLHYDFRLEMEGVLKSWAVPKGPSLNPSDKRLAVMVEDHPFSYRTFEGTIPKGNYGAGEVSIWDEGYYEPIAREKDNPGTTSKSDEEWLLEGLDKGSLKIVLHGKKLKGEFVLVKMHGAKEENAWLLIKHADEYAVKEPYDAENHSSSSSPSSLVTSPPPTSSSRRSKLNAMTAGQKKLSRYIKPMLATLGDVPFDSDEWVFEIKWDGYRAIADLREELQFYSRNGLSYLGRYKEIEKGLAQQPHRVVLDGEIVVYDQDGKPDFQKLQHYAENPDVPLVYHVFDLLHLNGHSTENLTLLERKELLKEALAETGSVQFCDHVENSGIGFFDAALDANLEGIMAKKKSSTYHEGARTPEWLKIKNHSTDEAVIAGFTEPRGSRKYFGSLILGKYVDGEFRYAGHVGTGFSEKRLKEIHVLLKPLITKEVPFDEKPATNAPPTWVKPEIVCTVKYSEVTADGLFRLPVFIALREDKEPEEVVTDDETLATDEVENADERVAIEKNKNAAAGKNTGKSTTAREDKSDLENVKFTNTDKLYWKKEKITKGALIDYYLSVSDYILPHLKDRAQSLHRFPNGIDGESFYHKNAGEDAPSWVETVHIFSESNNREIEYIVCNDKDTLGYLVNLGCIELNPWSNRVTRPGKPDYLIIDLDPSKENSFRQVVEAAWVTKEVLDACGVTGYCKTSGSTGIHIFVPTGGEYTYDQVRDFAQVLVHFVQQRLPDTTTLERSLRKRGPKIYLDYMQNGEGQTVASTYSARPKRQAPVSMPIEWNELTKDLSIQDFTIHNALDRLSKKGDIFLPVLKEKTNIEKAIEQLQSMD